MTVRGVIEHVWTVHHKKGEMKLLLVKNYLKEYLQRAKTSLTH